MRLVIAPLLLAALFILGIVGYQIFFAARQVEGLVMDGLTGRPVVGAKVVAGRAEAATDGQGRYYLGGLPANARLTIEADGYLPARLAVGIGGSLRTVLRPRELWGTVSDRYSGMPVAGATVASGDQAATTDAQGHYRLVGLRLGARVAAQAPGYAPAVATYSEQETLHLTVRPNTLSGVITDADTGRPIAGARASDGAHQALAGPDGAYRLTDLPEGATLVVSASGYERRRVPVGHTTRLDLTLKPLAIKALYMTYYGMGDANLRRHALDLINKTELNGIVIDVKGDRGWIAYKTAVSLARQVGAQQEIAIPDIDELMAYFKANGIYTIARIVVFKDNPLARSRPDLAVRDARTGGLWVDGEGLAWTDPFNEEVWDYNISLAREAALKGFDEIQFDYIRFPTDPSAGASVDTARYAQPNTMENRLAAINGFLKRAQAELKPLGVYLAVDVFGYTTWREDDMGIGQNIEALAPFVDYISPMVYPSTYFHGLPMGPSPSYLPAAAYPYEIVFYSLRKAAERLRDQPAKLRPWLQYFNDYGAAGLTYGEREIEAQKKATYDAGIAGWMMWDATNRYVKGGFR